MNNNSPSWKRSHCSRRQRQGIIKQQLLDKELQVFGLSYRTLPFCSSKMIEYLYFSGLFSYLGVTQVECTPEGKGQRKKLETQVVTIMLSHVWLAEEFGLSLPYQCFTDFGYTPILGYATKMQILMQ